MTPPAKKVKTSTPCRNISQPTDKEIEESMNLTNGSKIRFIDNKGKKLKSLGPSGVFETDNCIIYYDPKMVVEVEVEE